MNMNTQTAAEYLRGRGIQVTPGTLNVWRSQGRGPEYKKIYRRVYYDQAALDDFATGEPVKTMTGSRG